MLKKSTEFGVFVVELDLFYEVGFVAYRIRMPVFSVGKILKSSFKTYEIGTMA